MKETNDTPVNKQEKTKENPYKGLDFYKEKDKHLFYGRESETHKLFQLVKNNLLTVLFGKSGIGKTSLLNAGLFPRFRDDEFFPIRVVLNYSDKEPPLMEQVRRTIGGEFDNRKIEVKTRNGHDFSKPLAPGETLWEYFHRVKHFDPNKNKWITPVLVFDQFEELFTRGKDHKDKDALIDELYWLIENQLPVPFKEQVLKGNKEGIEFSLFSVRPDVRVIISLREDYLPHLNGLKARIPLIDRTLYRLIHLNGNQAREIITMPGGFQEENVIENILKFFYPEDSKDDNMISLETLEIEPVLLSLLCYQLFEREGQKLKTITKQEQEKILEDFYDSVLQEFPEEVKEFIESKLLTEGGFRTPLYLEPHLPLRNSIHKLVKQRILRVFNDGKKEYIEIIHDVLASIIREKRNKRLNEIRKKELSKKIEEERRFYRALFKLGLILGIIILIISVFFIYQTIRLDKKNKDLLELNAAFRAMLEFPRDNTRAMRIAVEAFEIGLPEPRENTYQLLSTVGYSSFDDPFYIAAMKHEKEVRSAVFSPDGNQVLTACEDGTARLWDTSGNFLRAYQHHSGGTTAVLSSRILSSVFSLDGKRILTASWDKTAKVWDRQGNLLADLKEKHTGPVTSAVFSPDGTLILTTSRDRTAKLWDSRGVYLKDLAHESHVTSAEFSKNGERILTASWDKTVKVWDVSGNLLAELKHEGAVLSAFFSPGGNQIISACRDNSARVWDLEEKNGKLLEKLKYKLQHEKIVTHALFSPDGSYMLTASRDGTAILWNDAGNRRAVLKHQGELSFGGFPPDGSKVLTGSRDGRVTLWDLDGKLLLELKRFNGIVYSAVFSPHGRWILTACQDGTVKIWDIYTKLVTPLNKHQQLSEINTAVFSPDGRKILTTSSDYTAKTWDLEGNFLHEFLHQDIVNTGVFSPDSSKILTSSKDKTAKLWTQDGEFLADLNHKDGVISAEFSTDGSKIITASEDGTAKVWELKNIENHKKTEIKLLANLNKHDAAVLSAVFSKDGSMIVTASVDNTAKVFELDGKFLADLIGHQDAVNSAVFSPDGSMVLTASQDMTAILWDLQGNQLHIYNHAGPVVSALFSPNGKRILTASGDSTAKLWTIAGKVLAEFKHQRDVLSAVFSPDNKRIITASSDGTAKLWDQAGRLLADLNKHMSTVNSAVFSPDGLRMLTGSRDGTAIVWLTPESIYDWLKTAKIPTLSPI